MLLRPLLVSTLLCCVSAGRNLTDDAQNFVAKFREMNDTKDVLSSLDQIGEHGRELYRLGRPLISLLRTGVNLTEKAGTDEASAIIELRQLFTIDDMRHHFTPAIFSVRSFLDDLYTGVISIRLHMAADTLSTIGDPQTSDFIRQLQGVMHHAEMHMMSILGTVDASVRTNCALPNKEGMKRLTRVQDILRFVQTRVYGNESDEDWENYRKHNLSPYILHATTEEIKNFTKNLTETASPTHEMVLEYVRNNMTSTYKIMNSCMLEMKNIESDFNQTEFLLSVTRWYKDLLRIELYQWVVSAVIEPDEEAYNTEAEIVILSFERTGKYMAKWIRQFQIVSWPEIGVDVVKDSLGYNPISKNAYNETARKVQEIFEESGLSSFAYQVLVVPTSEMDVSWSVGTVGDGNYVNITNYNGVDVHIFRYNRTESVKRSANANKWIEQKKEAIMKAIKNGAMSRTDVSLAYLHKDASTGPIYSQDLFRSVILLKRKGDSESSFLMGLATFENASVMLETSKTKYSVIRNAKETHYSFRAFFSL